MRFRHLAGMFTLILLTGLCLTGCFRQNVIPLTVEIPQMKSMECSKVIQDALGRIDGIVAAEPNIEARTMTIRFDTRKLNVKNVEYLIAGLGFDVNKEKGKPEARAALPENCR